MPAVAIKISPQARPPRKRSPEFMRWIEAQASLRLSLSERFARAHSGLGFRVMFVLAAVLGRVRQQDAEFTGGAALVLVGVSVMGSGIALCGAWLVWPDRAYW